MTFKNKKNLLYEIEVRIVVILKWKGDEGAFWVAVNVLMCGFLHWFINMQKFT